MSHDRTRHRRPGVALLMALTLVLVLSTFLSELFFSTGLELRAMQTFKSAQQARSLAKSAFKALQIGLMGDEAAFMQGYRRIQDLLRVAALPLENGLLLELTVQPLDGLYNLNELAGLRPDSPKNIARWYLFRNIVTAMAIPAETEGGVPGTVTEAQAAQLYAALFDWMDSDDAEYAEFVGLRGAEADSYFDVQPDYAIKNASLDRLSEITLVRGIRESGIPWEAWKEKFAAIPSGGSDYFPERLNVNVADREQIIAYLRTRWIPLDELGEGAGAAIDDQKAINAYANNAEVIAYTLIPENEERPVYDQPQLQEALTLPGLIPRYAGKLFTVVSSYYRIALTTEVDGISATLRAVLHVPRHGGGATGTEVLWFTLN